VSSATLPTGELWLVARSHGTSVRRTSAGQRAVLRSLADGARTWEDLCAVAAEHDGDRGPADLVPFLDQLRARGWLAITVTSGGRPVHTMEPLRPPPPAPPTAETEAGLVLSRFAVLHRDGDGLVLESPRAWCDIRVHDPRALGALGGPTGSGALRLDVERRLRRDLRWAGLVVPEGGPEDTEPRSRQWSPHELWFYDRSREGDRLGLGDGLGYRLRDGLGIRLVQKRFVPPPARPEEFTGPAVPLPAPDLDALRHNDATLTAILEDRRTIRHHDEANPPTRAQLGEFLYRCARTRSVYVDDGVELLSRPYPAGGSCYELEVYPVVRHATDVPAGMYHYDSHAHQLRLIQEVSHHSVRRLLRASTPMGAGPPQILFVISARADRLMWKYEALAYALALKHVGVLQQTMYCVATAMGLAPCALGSGDAAAFTRATGRDPLVECGVGEFALGTPHDPAYEWTPNRAAETGEKR
jgi:SagB-type dehydrogenase family enzyme